MGVVTAVGRALPRVEGRGKVTGRAVYTADVTRPGICYAVMVQADVPHGRITADSLRHATEIASAAAGVLPLITPLNCPPLNPPPRELSYDLPLERRPPLADLTVRHVGQTGTATRSPWCPSPSGWTSSTA